VTFAPDAKKHVLEDTVLGRGPAHVAGRSAIDLDVRTAAPDRTCPRLPCWKERCGRLASKMLAFAFRQAVVQKPGQQPVPQTQTQEEVAVNARLDPPAAATRCWSRSRSRTPRAAPASTVISRGSTTTESCSCKAGNKKRSLAGARGGDRVEARRAEVDYEFTESAAQPLPATLDGWTLLTRTPPASSSWTAPFALHDLPLP